MGRVTCLCLLSIAFFRCNFADPLVMLYGASSIGHCGENAAGEISGRDTNGSIASIGNYSTLQEALERLSSYQFSHYTVCLRSGANYSVSSLTSVINSSVGILSGGGDKAKVYCNRTSSSETSHTIYFKSVDEVRLENLAFEGCSAPLSMELVQHVSISRCSFQYFTEAVFDIFNSPLVLISDSIFQHNFGTGISTQSSRGNTGAVALGFKDTPDDIRNISVEIKNSTFFNNSAYTQSLDVAIDSTVYPGRGGAVGVFLSHSFENVSVIVANCMFRENFASAYGGALLYLITNDNVLDNVYFRDTMFDSNIGGLGASGMLLTYIARNIESEIPTTFTITDCVFMNHVSQEGGALTLFPSYFGGGGSRMVVTRSLFVGNRENLSTPFSYGSAIAISEVNIFADRTSLPRHEIRDCTFLNNSGENGIFNNGYAPVKFSGTNRFIANRGNPLKVVGALVEFRDRLEFINNTVPNSAAVYFQSFSQARIVQGLSIWFEGNIGRFGASLFVDNPTIPVSNTAVIYNSLCFFLYENFTTPPAQWKNVSITSVRNSAIEGASLYIRRLEPCAWTSFSPPFFNLTSVRDWPIWDIRDNINSGFEGDIKTDVQSLTVTTSQVAVWPNQLFPVAVSVLDQFGLPTSVTAQYSYTSKDARDERVLLQPELDAITSEDEFIQNFSAVTDSLSAEGTVFISNGLQSKAFQTEVNLNSFELQMLPCPGGYRAELIETRAGLWGCVCDSEIDELLFCQDDQDTIVIEYGKWAVYVPSSSHNLKFYPCPAGYCRCTLDDNIDMNGTMCMFRYTNSDPNQQCDCHRRGTLCGECVNSSSVTALFNHCSNCTHTYILLIPALVICDVAVFIVLALLNVPLPEWTYPFIFYIQMAPYLVQYFPNSFDKVGKYGYFISSASSFYFIHDFCLYDGMSALAGYALRYLPLLLAILTLPPVMCIKRRVASCRRIRYTGEHHGLWWVVLLAFSHTVYTSMAILNCPSITNTNGETNSRWFVNGEVQCFTGAHLPLGLLATLILVVTSLLIPLTAGITLNWRNYAKPQWIIRLRDALCLSFREDCEWWASVELARRTLLLLILHAFPRNTAALILVLAITLTVYGHCQPYKSRLTNLLEIAILTDLLILLLLRETPVLIDDYLTFPGEGSHNVYPEGVCTDTPDGIATIAWILFPFYYAPVLLFTVSLAVYATVAVRRYVKIETRWLNRNQKTGRSDSDHDPSVTYRDRFELNPSPTHTSVRVNRGMTRGVASIHGKDMPNSAELSEPFIQPI